MNSPLPLSLYIHIPWCIKKCPYCDFNSHEIRKTNTDPYAYEAVYCDALLLDLRNTLDYLKIRSSNTIIPNIHSIFIGGGTPSLFSAKSLDEILTKINTLLTIPKECEITLEANPGTYESKKFSDFKSIGINRLSIGVQSFDNNCLQSLGRIHNSQQAIKAIDRAKELDFNLNIDLMHSLPNQTTALAIEDLKIATSFEPHHLSWYQLTIEPNTAFAKKPPILPNDHILDNIYYSGLNFLCNNGYTQYEISAFTSSYDNLKNFKSIHNLNYWRYGDYIGIGAGAHSKFTIRSNTDIKTIRQWKQKSPERYISSDFPKLSGESFLNSDELILEYMMNRLRILEPLSEQELNFYTNLTFSDIKLSKSITKALEHKWVTLNNINHSYYLTVTDLGRQFLNNLILLF